LQSVSPEGRRHEQQRQPQENIPSEQIDRERDGRPLSKRKLPYQNRRASLVDATPNSEADKMCAASQDCENRDEGQSGEGGSLSMSRSPRVQSRHHHHQCYGHQDHQDFQDRKVRLDLAEQVPGCWPHDNSNQSCKNVHTSQHGHAGRRPDSKTDIMERMLLHALPTIHTPAAQMVSSKTFPPVSAKATSRSVTRLDTCKRCDVSEGLSSVGHMSASRV
jgi:hypothetical protein